ncbi:MAG: hypothetical protein IPJ03_16635 [Ignavibacteriales bacterium]|nr:hypothetical protein [Ignavibacteriales bacterium]
MKAYHGKQEIKDNLLKQLKAHFDFDEIVKGKYWENGKGCAVGCSIHSGNHKDYETLLGIPEWLAHVEDRVFEGLPLERAKMWPLEFSQAIKIGQDLERIKIPFLIFIVESTIDKFDHKKYPKVLSSIKEVLKQLKKKKIDKDKMLNAADAAASAAAAYAAAYAAYAAYAAADAAAAAAYATAYAAADAATAAADDAAYAAADATDDAAYATAVATDDAAYAAAVAADDARSKQYVIFADKLLELTREYE